MSGGMWLLISIIYLIGACASAYIGSQMDGSLTWERHKVLTFIVLWPVVLVISLVAGLWKISEEFFQ